MSSAEAEDFASHVQLKLVENDFAIVRKFRGESSFSSYLTVVVAMIFRDYRAAAWGRWRPSAAAMKHGPVAVLLENLVYRDGMSFNNAKEVIRSRGYPDTTERQFIEIFRELPRRGKSRPTMVAGDVLATHASKDDADGLLLAKERQEQERIIVQHLARALQSLPQEERLMVKMHVVAGLSVAQVSRTLGVEQKPMYRRLERALRAIRKHLERAGISWPTAAAAIHEVDR